MFGIKHHCLCYTLYQVRLRIPWFFYRDDALQSYPAHIRLYNQHDEHGVYNQCLQPL